MPVPALIRAGSAVVLAANPAVAVPLAAVYAANMAIRASYKVAEYNIQQDQVNKLHDIVTALDNIVNKLDVISSRIYDSENDINLAEAVQRKGAMPDELHIHINNDTEDSTSDERWTVYP